MDKNTLVAFCSDVQTICLHECPEAVETYEFFHFTIRFPDNTAPGARATL